MLTGIYVYVDDPGARAQVRERLENDLADRYGLVIVLQKELKQYIMDAFDQTFAITYALQLIAIVVAVLAIVNTFSAAILERQREIGILRCMGFFRAQIRKMVLVDSRSDRRDRLLVRTAERSYAGPRADLCDQQTVLRLEHRVSRSIWVHWRGPRYSCS